MSDSQLVLNGQQFTDFVFTPLGSVEAGTYPLIEAGSISGSLGPITSGEIDGLPANIAIDRDNLVLTVDVPEPGTLVLFSAAVAAVAYRRRRTRSWRTNRA